MDDLVKRLRNIGDGGIYEKCEGCEHGEDYPDCVGCTHKAFYDAADAIEKLQGELAYWHKAYWNLWRENRWIPVTERLPEEDGWYQVYAPYYSGGSSSGLKNINGNMYSAFKHGKWSIEVGYHKRPGCVKAWKPLPKPPEED